VFKISLLFLYPFEEYFELPGLNPDCNSPIKDFFNDSPSQANAYYCVTMYNEYAVLREVWLKYYVDLFYRQLSFMSHFRRESLILAEKKRAVQEGIFRVCILSVSFASPRMEQFPCIRGKFTVDFPLDSGTGECFR